jgi:hypothetical protein
MAPATLDERFRRRTGFRPPIVVPRSQAFYLFVAISDGQSAVVFSSNLNYDRHLKWQGTQLLPGSRLTPEN